MSGIAVISQNTLRVRGPSANRLCEITPDRLRSAPDVVTSRPSRHSSVRANPSRSSARGGSLLCEHVHGRTVHHAQRATSPHRHREACAASITPRPIAWRCDRWDVTANRRASASIRARDGRSARCRCTSRGRNAGSAVDRRDSAAVSPPYAAPTIVTPRQASPAVRHCHGWFASTHQTGGQGRLIGDTGVLRMPRGSSRGAIPHGIGLACPDRAM